MQLFFLLTLKTSHSYSMYYVTGVFSTFKSFIKKKVAFFYISNHLFTLESWQQTV